MDASTSGKCSCFSGDVWVVFLCPNNVVGSVLPWSFWWYDACIQWRSGWAPMNFILFSLFSSLYQNINMFFHLFFLIQFGFYFLDWYLFFKCFFIVFFQLSHHLVSIKFFLIKFGPYFFNCCLFFIFYIKFDLYFDRYFFFTFLSRVISIMCT